MIVLFGLIGFSNKAIAWRVCNQTSYILEAATGIASLEDRSITSSGWLRIRPGSCVTAQGELQAEDHVWIYALSAPVHNGGRRVWGGRSRLCVDDRAFENKEQTSCEARGMRTAGFREVVLRTKNGIPRLSLVEPAGFSLKKAREAGIQRLLRDNGMKIRSIDGNFGTASVRLARKFKSDNGLTNMDIRSGAFIDALEKANNEKKAKKGLVFCNQTDDLVWTALARQEKGDVWVSRGWWTLLKGECRKLLSEMPGPNPVYFYAEKGEVVERLNATERSFCTSEGRFVIREHEQCINSGFMAASFRKVARPEGGEDAPSTPIILNLTGEDFEPLPRSFAGRLLNDDTE